MCFYGFEELAEHVELVTSQSLLHFEARMWFVGAEVGIDPYLDFAGAAETNQVVVDGDVAEVAEDNFEADQCFLDDVDCVTQWKVL